MLVYVKGKIISIHWDEDFLSSGIWQDYAEPLRTEIETGKWKAYVGYLHDDGKLADSLGGILVDSIASTEEIIEEVLKSLDDHDFPTDCPVIYLI